MLFPGCLWPWQTRGLRSTSWVLPRVEVTSLLSHCREEALHHPCTQDHIWFLHTSHSEIPKQPVSPSVGALIKPPAPACALSGMCLLGSGRPAIILLTLIIQYALEWASNQLFYYNLQRLKSWQTK